MDCSKEQTSEEIPQPVSLPLLKSARRTLTEIEVGCNLKAADSVKNNDRDTAPSLEKQKEKPYRGVERGSKNTERNASSGYHSAMAACFISSFRRS